MLLLSSVQMFLYRNRIDLTPRKSSLFLGFCHPLSVFSLIDPPLKKQSICLRMPHQAASWAASSIFIHFGPFFTVSHFFYFLGFWVLQLYFNTCISYMASASPRWRFGGQMTDPDFAFWSPRALNGLQSCTNVTD